MADVVQYVIATLLPSAATVVLYLLMHHSRLREANYWVWQVIAGLVFGAIAVYGTEFGIPIPGATINVRDAAPITAGLIFGGPAGIIAGLIGGIERWFAALWGRGMFTRAACSAATCLAGIYAAVFHHFIMDERKPTMSLGFAIGAMIEVLHLTLIFLTNPDETHRAFAVVQTCWMTMIMLNGIAVALSIMAAKLVLHEKLIVRGEQRRISESVLSGMMPVIIAAFGLTSSFTILLQNSLTQTETNELLSLNIQDVRYDVRKESDNRLLQITREIAELIPSCSAAGTMDLASLARRYDVAEIHVIGMDGTIVASSDDQYLGFDMATGDQSAAFLVLLPGARATEYVQRYRPMAYDETVWRKYAGVTIEDGIVQVGYDASQFQNELASHMMGSTGYRHIGETGFVLIVNGEGEIVSSISGMNGRKIATTGISRDLEAAAPNTLFRTTYLTTPCYAMYAKVEGYTVIALQPMEEADFSRNVAIVVGSFVSIIVFAALFTAIYHLIKRLVVKSIWRINGRLAQITSGDLDTVVDVRTNEEFALLSDDINQTVRALKGYIEEAEARIDTELEYARQIQLAALPNAFPYTVGKDGFEVYALMDAARQVGGDFYDFYMLDENHFAFLVADVSGKGIPAALFMMRAKSEIRGYVERGYSVSEAFRKANDRLCEGNDADMFVTAWMGVLDLRSGEVVFANAGHNPPVVWTAGRGWEYLSMRKNLILGCMEGIPYRANELELEPGDIVFLYTDGVVEAMDEQEGQYGTDRLLHALSANADKSMKELCRAIRADVNDFVGEADQFDDITMLALRYEGGKPQANG